MKKLQKNETNDTIALQIQIGEIIRRHRKKLGVTQEGLAERLDLTTNYVAHLERGSRGLSLKTLVTLAKAFGCGVKDLMPPGVRFRR